MRKSSTTTMPDISTRGRVMHPHNSLLNLFGATMAQNISRTNFGMA
ncbi:hypothetical protein [Rubritalea tangerina]